MHFFRYAGHCANPDQIVIEGNVEEMNFSALFIRNDQVGDDKEVIYLFYMVDRSSGNMWKGSCSCSSSRSNASEFDSFLFGISIGSLQCRSNYSSCQGKIMINDKIYDEFAQKHIGNEKVIPQ